MQIEFKGRYISVKDFDCKFGTLQEEPVAPFVNIFVKVTKGCNARCLFCSNADASEIRTPFNVPKLLDAVMSLRDLGVKVNRINITGGEPSVVPQLVGNILSVMSEPSVSDIHMHLNTNGLLPQSQELMRHPRWDSISMSLHHYDRMKLSELYGCHIPERAFDFEGIAVEKLNSSCNLVKGYIDNMEEARKMLDFNLDLGIQRVGFVALMKVNDYCRKHFVDLEDIRLENIPHVYFTKSMSRGNDCKCSNYLYNRGLNVLDIYMRNYVNYNYCESSLVYDGEFLRQGFSQDNIIF
ncbi:MAG: radical SAM protein [Bacteroidales bacterium]|nr:radical SAM protein [Bacteroidales bacterium]